MLPLLVGHSHLVQRFGARAIVLGLLQETLVVADGGLVLLQPPRCEGQLVQSLQLQGKWWRQLQHGCALFPRFLISFQVHQTVADEQVHVVGNHRPLLRVFTIGGDGLIPPSQALEGRSQAEGGEGKALVFRVSPSELLKSLHRR